MPNNWFQEKNILWLEFNKFLILPKIQHLILSIENLTISWKRASYKEGTGKHAYDEEEKELKINEVKHPQKSDGYGSFSFGCGYEYPEHH